MDERIEKAKREYPIDTQFYPAHTSISEENYSIVINTNFRYDECGNLIAPTSENKTWCSLYASDFKLHGTVNYERIIWYKANNKWATIKKRVIPCPEIFPYDPKTVQSLIELWEEMSKRACITGNSIHEGTDVIETYFPTIKEIE